MAAYDDLNTKRIFTVGILSILVTTATALAVQVVYYALVSWHEADLAERSSYRRQNQVLEEQTKQISNYGVNPETGSVTIPVSQAMQLIAVSDHSQDSSGDKKKETSHGKDGDDHTTNHKKDSPTEKKPVEGKADKPKAAAESDEAKTQDKPKSDKETKKEDES